MSVKGYESAREIFRSKRKARHPAYMGMSAEFTFLAQFQLKLAMSVR
jgi:hypothetical protein